VTKKLEDKQVELFPDVPKRTKSRPLQRSKAHMEKNGWSVAIVEKWIPPRGNMEFGVRKDVWGFGDLLACRPQIGIPPPAIALVQCCRAADMAAHKAKILAIKDYYFWRSAGGKVFLQGWSKKGGRGKVKRWALTEEELMEAF
jgi:hypothetical protein